MNIIEKSYNLRNDCLSDDRVFSDDFLLNLYDYIEDEKDKERYIDILNTEFRGDIPDKFIEVIKMELKDTVEMMKSFDYMERFRAEYFQLKIRMNALSKMLVKYKEGTLSFTPLCSYDLLARQLSAMRLYAFHLEERADIEGINLYK